MIKIVEQKCNICGMDVWTELENLNRYCSRCGYQDFTLIAENTEELNAMIFNQKKSVEYKPGKWEGDLK